MIMVCGGSLRLTCCKMSFSLYILHILYVQCIYCCLDLKAMQIMLCSAANIALFSRGILKSFTNPHEQHYISISNGQHSVKRSSPSWETPAKSFHWKQLQNIWVISAKGWELQDIMKLPIANPQGWNVRVRGGEERRMASQTTKILGWGQQTEEELQDKRSFRKGGLMFHCLYLARP